MIITQNDGLMEEWLSYSLRYPQLRKYSAGVLLALLPMNLHANVHPGVGGRQQMYLGPCCIFERCRLSYQFLTLSWSSPDYCRHLSSEPMD